VTEVRRKMDSVLQAVPKHLNKIHSSQPANTNQENLQEELRKEISTSQEELKGCSQ
jgi:hypothetical protein